MDKSHGILLGTLTLVIILFFYTFNYGIEEFRTPESGSFSIQLAGKGLGPKNFPGKDGDPGALLDNGPEFYFYVAASSPDNEKVSFSLDYDKGLWRDMEVSVLEGEEYRRLNVTDGFTVPVGNLTMLRFSMRYYGVEDPYAIKVAAQKGGETKTIGLKGKGEGYPSSGTVCFVLWSGDASGPSIYESIWIDTLTNAGFSVRHKFTTPSCPYDEGNINNKTADFSNYSFWAHSRMALTSGLGLRPVNDLDEAKKYYVDALKISELIMGVDVKALATMGYATAQGSPDSVCFTSTSNNQLVVVRTDSIFPSSDYTVSDLVTVNTAPSGSRVMCSTQNASLIPQITPFADDGDGGSADGYRVSGNYTQACSGKMAFAGFSYTASLTTSPEDNGQEIFNNTVNYLDFIPRLNITFFNVTSPVYTDTNYNISLNVKNVGKANLTSSTWLNITLPQGWAIVSGTGNVSIGNLNVNDTLWNNITVRLNASASFGSQRIESHSSGCGAFSNSSTLVNVVPFGSASVKVTFPNFRVLANQTFNLTVNITATGGDLRNVNATLSIVDQGPMNISAGENFTKPVFYNISNSSSLLVNWSAFSNVTGLTKIVVEATPQNGTKGELSTTFSIILPNTSAGLLTLNVTNTTTFVATIVGNVTPIKSVNFTIAKTYTQSTEVVQGNLTMVVNETVCVGSSSTGNVALQSENTSATCQGSGNCNNTIDNSTSTSVTIVSGGWLNVTLRDQFIIDRLEIIWDDIGTEANASIFYKKGNDWSKISPPIQYVNPPNATNTSTYVGFTPFQTKSILINSSTGTTVIYEFRAFSAEERVGNCYVFEANYSNTTRSGRYGVDSNVTLSSQRGLVKDNFSFSVNFGNPKITIDAPSAMQIASQRTYKAIIEAVGGDLRNLTVNLTSANISIINITAGQNPTNISQILYGQSDQRNWTVNATGAGVSLTTVYVNSTTAEGYFQNAGQNITTFSDPGMPPNVTNFSFSYLGKRTNVTNLLTAFVIEANVSDDVALDSVKANISYPSGTVLNASMSFVASDGVWANGTWQIWRSTFSSSSPAVNESGNYTVTIIAVDIGLQEKRSGIDPGSPASLQFMGNSTFTINATNFSLFNRGESVRAEAYDVNGNLESSLSWDLNVTRYQQNTSAYYSNFPNDTISYLVASADPEGNYTILFRANKSGNSGNVTKLFNVTRDLTVNILSPPENNEYDTSSQIDNPSVTVQNVRGTLVNDSTVNAVCANQSQQVNAYSLTYQSCFVGSYSFSCGNVQCYSTSSAGATFSVTVNSTDQFNNSGSKSINLRTKSATTTTGGGGGGGGGNGGGPAPAPAAAKKTADFNFTIERSILLRQGDNASVILSLRSDVSLRISIGALRTCCNLSFRSAIGMKEGESRDEKVFIYAPLSTLPGEYFIDFSLSSPGVAGKTVSVKVTVTQRPEVARLEELEQRLGELKESILGYQTSGVDVAGPMEGLDAAERSAREARRSLLYDDLAGFIRSLEEGERQTGAVEVKLGELVLIKLVYDNKWDIAASLVAFFLVSYLMTQVYLPYRRLSRSLAAYRKDESLRTDARKKTERQYFRREIDENTFREIMIREQEKILEARSGIKEANFEMRELLKRKLNPIEVLRWVVTAPFALARWLLRLRKPPKPGRQVAVKGGRIIAQMTVRGPHQEKEIRFVPPEEVIGKGGKKEKK